MSRELLNLEGVSDVWSRSDQMTTAKILAIGDLREWQEQGHALPNGGGIAFLAFHEVTESVLQQFSPATVFSPVLARDFDCIELAILLHNIGFSGVYRAIGKGLPKPELIEQEVLQMCPRLKFEIVRA